MIREKQRKSGRLLEIDLYPVFSDGRRIPTRESKTKATSEAQQKYNTIQRQKKAVRLINANFETGDLKIDTTWLPENAPLTKENALKQFRKFIREVKKAREKELRWLENQSNSNPNSKVLKAKRKKLMQEFKYYASVQEVKYKSGLHKGKSNWHFHIIMTGGLDRDSVEELWLSKARINADRFRPDVFGPEAAAKYLSRDCDGKRTILRSRNLINPTVAKISDGRIGKDTVSRIAKLRVDDKEYWERKYKGYRFLRCYARYNQYNGNWYISAVMYKSGKDEELPDWSYQEWLTEDMKVKRRE